MAAMECHDSAATISHLLHGIGVCFGYYDHARCSQFDANDGSTANVHGSSNGTAASWQAKLGNSELG